MLIRDIGILGMGLWEGPPVGNEAFADKVEQAQVRDPYRGRRSDDGIVRIAGMELHQDRHRRTLEALMHSFTDPYRGTTRRRYFPPEMKVSDAETAAARAALDDAGVKPSEIGAVLVQSFLPDQIQPKNAALVAYNLGIFDAPAWEVDSICNSTITQAHVAASLIHSGQARHVLCVQSVAYSRVMDLGVSASIQEGDMASAFVMGPRKGAELSFAWRTDGRLHAALRLGWGVPAAAPPRRYWEAAPERLLVRFDEALQQQVMGELPPNADAVCGAALREAGLSIEELDLFVSHQPMSWYAPLMADLLGLRDGVTCTTFAEYGNISSSSIPASLCQARAEGRLVSGARFLFFSPATGYVYGAVAGRW